MSSTNLWRFITILVLVFGTAHTNAATIYLRWSGESGNTIQVPSLGEADVEIWIDLVDGDTLSGVFFSNTGTNGLRQVDTVANLTGWSDDSVHDLLGGASQVVAFASTTTNGMLTTAGSYLLGTQTIRLETCVADQPLPVTFDHDSLWVLDADAGRPTWDPRYNTSDSGYIAYGDYGNPGWTGGGMNPGQPTPNPLYIECDVTTQGLQAPTTTSNGLRVSGVCNAPPIDINALGDEVCGCIDLVFLVDVTASVSDTLACIKDTNGLATVIDLAQVRAGADMDTQALRVGLLTFDGDGVSDFVTVLHPLTTDIATVEDTISDLAEGSGGNGPEASDEASERCLMRQIARMALSDSIRLSAMNASNTRS